MRLFARKLTSGDAIVTFNYDVALEIELIRANRFRVRDGYGFEADWNEPNSDVKLLKLHGSINWTGEIAGPRPGFSAGGIRLLGPYVDNRQSLLPGYDSVILDKTCSGRGGITDRSITMILPTHRKRFGVETSLGDEWSGVYQRLWNKADRLVAEADRIVMIGYSMPRAEERATQLLLGRSNKDVRLAVCCDKATGDIEQRFRDAGFTSIQRIGDPTFDGYLAHQPA